jgi:hypothetical protein
MFSDVLRGDMRSPRISQRALGTLPEDGNVMPKHVGATTHNKLNEQLVYLLVFHAYFYWGFNF